MSPVDVDKIKRVKPSFIDYDRPCVSCGYNLIGLMSDGVCPECGRKIKIRKQEIQRYSDNLVNAPASWLAAFATGSLLLFFGSLTVFVALGVGAWLAARANSVGAMFAALAAAVWFAGVWMVTRPRPVMNTTMIDPRKEWRGLRWSARVTQVFWLLAALMLIASAESGQIAFAWAALPSFAIAAGGMLPLCVLLSNLAHWGSDSGLAGHFRACAWLLGFAGTLLTLHGINVLTGAMLMGGSLAALIALALIYCAAIPFFYMMFCCFLLQGMSRWALLNHATADAKTERLRRQAELAANRSPDSLPPSNNVDAAAFNLGDSDVSRLSGANEVKHHGHVYRPVSKSDAAKRAGEP